jgi:hypothetical protein
MIFDVKWSDRVMSLLFHGSNVASCYLSWVILNFTAAQLYIKYCVGTTFIDMIYSIFYVPSPHCQGLSWVIFHGSRNITAMWFIIGTYMSSIFLQNMCSNIFTKTEREPEKTTE